jgi:hypothetical protein
MKKQLFTLMLTVMSLYTLEITAQATIARIPRSLTPKHMFDTLSDRFGNKYNLADLSLLSTRPFGGGTTISSVPSESCSAGYFVLFFAPNTIFTSGTFSSQAQTVMCEVFKNISGFINSPLSFLPGVGPKINIYCDNMTSGNFLAQASSIFAYPNLPASNTPGIIDGLVYKMLTSGIDPYSGIPSTNFSFNLPGQNNFYHGLVEVNPNVASWNFNLATTTIGNSDNDFYTVMLHEATHVLGFLSLIFSTGTSIYGANNNYYHRYDQFLKDVNGNSLVYSTSAPACLNSYTAFNSTLTLSNAVGQTNCTNPNADLLTTCSVSTKYVSPTTTVAVCTPTCYQAGVSLSHFEDICYLPPGFTTTCPVSPPGAGFNNLYFLMANWSDPGSCYVKRYLKEEEKNVLCDLGYSVAITYTSVAAGATHSYSNACNPTATLVGINDGLSNGVYTYTTNSTSVNILMSSITANDLPSGLSISCLEVVYNNATVSISGSSLVVTATQGIGLVLLKYLPQNTLNQFGNATYIFVYFQPAGCSVVGDCNIVQNPGFEILSSGAQCGVLGSQSPPIAVCGWENYIGLSSVSSTMCNSNFNQYNLGQSTFSSTPPVSNFNGSANNNRVVSVRSNSVGGTSIKNSLSSPLIPGQGYKLSLWAINPTSNIPGGINPNSLPSVISVFSYTAAGFTPSVFPGNLNPITQITVTAGSNWSLFTYTFVYSSTLSPAPSLIIGSDYNNALAIGQSSVYLECYFDEITLTPISSPTFALPQVNICTGVSYTNLAQYASAVQGVFSGVGVTASGTSYDFNAAGTLPAGSYPIAFNYTLAPAGCSGTVWQNVTIGNNFTFTATNSGTYCLNTNTVITLSAASSGTAAVSYNWLPGNLSGNTVTVSPSVSTIYTVTGNVGACSGTQTVGVNVFNSCCGSTTFTPFALGGGQNTILGPAFIASDLTLPGGGSFFLFGETIFGNNVKLTVPAGATLNVQGAHLYSCGGYLWKGIVVEDGGVLNFSQNSSGGPAILIENALKAIDVSTYSTSSNASILNIYNTIFNKNYIDINIANYQRSSFTFSNVFNINSCVFSCRNFTYTGTQWPDVATTTGGLRFANTATTGLAPPYSLQSASLATLLSPHAGETSSVAINLENVGLTSGNNFYPVAIGNNTASAFNLFDNHVTFIKGLHSNLITNNNVFQNTSFPYAALGTGCAIYWAATNGNINTLLDLSASNTNLGNRFWNCKTGVEGKNTHTFRIEKAIFRSTQVASTSPFTLGTGYKGIVMATNRFRYIIHSNEFTNIKTGVSIPIAAGASTLAQSCSVCVAYGIYASNLSVSFNTFSKGTGSGNYVDKAIDISAPNTVPWVVVNNFSISPYIGGILIDNNLMTDVFRGIYVTGIKGCYTRIQRNDITLIEDGVNNLAQRGIDLSNCTAAPNNRQYIIENTVTGGANTFITNSVSLVQVGSTMGPGLHSPSVTCNTISNCHKGFVFDSNNSGTMWYANHMSGLNYGMYLQNHGIIGQQGSTFTGMGNQWNGGGFTGTNYGIFTYSSTPSLSVLYVTSTLTPQGPPNAFGFPGTALSYLSPGNVVITSMPNDFDCYTFNGVITTSTLPQAENYSDDDNAWFMAKMAHYQFLHLNDSIRQNTPLLEAFYNQQTGNSLDKFMQIEQHLATGNFSNAATINAAVSPTNAVESHYKAYYNLYLAFASNNFEPNTTANKDDLIELASLCPGKDGACVYQARALYHTVFKVPFDFPETCFESAGRIARNDSKNFLVIGKWQIDIFPNPTNNRLNIRSNVEKENLEISIYDLSGRPLLLKNLELTGFSSFLDFNLIDGAYFIVIVNSQNEKVVKKLLINN